MFRFETEQRTSELPLNYCVYPFHGWSPFGLEDGLESESVMSPDAKAFISEMAEVRARCHSVSVCD